MNELALFAGAGGGILGGRLLGWRTVCAVEIDDYARNALVARQNDGSLEPFPIWDDVRTFDGRPWRGIVDVISGGFPCQDISAAGKGAGITGERSGLWFDMARIICEVRPRYVLVENSPLLVCRGLERILSDLAELGYDATWGIIGADAVGLPHHRTRIWLVANSSERNGRTWNLLVKGKNWKSQIKSGRLPRIYMDFENWKASQGDENFSIFYKPDDGMADRLGEVAAIGNGQVPAVVALAWRELTGLTEEGR